MMPDYLVAAAILGWTFLFISSYVQYLQWLEQKNPKPPKDVWIGRNEPLVQIKRNPNRDRKKK